MGETSPSAARGRPALMASFTGDERRALARALAEGDDDPSCPACGAVLTRQAVRRPEEVAYVRKRVWLLCPSCKRSGAVDLPS